MTGRALAVGGTVQSVFLLAILIAGYVVCFALWWFVFRGRDDE
jgi:hypothetical protein